MTTIMTNTTTTTTTHYLEYINIFLNFIGSVICCYWFLVLMCTKRHTPVQCTLLPASDHCLIAQVPFDS